MNMVYCRGCAKEIHETAPTCPQCGYVQRPVVATSPSQRYKKREMSTNAKFHVTLIVTAGIGVLLLYTTMAFSLINLATGLSFGLSVRLFISHQENNFLRTSKLDWILLVACSIAALLFMLTGLYNIQAICLIYVAVRSLMVYFMTYGGDTERIEDKKQ